MVGGTLNLTTRANGPLLYPDAKLHTWNFMAVGLPLSNPGSITVSIIGSGKLKQSIFTSCNNNNFFRLQIFVVSFFDRAFIPPAWLGLGSETTLLRSCLKKWWSHKIESWSISLVDFLKVAVIQHPPAAHNKLTVGLALGGTNFGGEERKSVLKLILEI